MAKDIKINFSDLNNGRDLQRKLGLNSVETMRLVRKKMDGASHQELQQVCEKVFTMEDPK